MWHSLAGLSDERDTHLDFARCFPQVRDEYQPRCSGMTIRVRGDGHLKLELKSPDERVLWWATRDLCTDDWCDLGFTWSPDDLRRVKFLEWTVDPGSRLEVGPLRLLIDMPDVSIGERVFLESYAKLARLYSSKHGTVRDNAHLHAGERDSIPASGLFCLATCVAATMGVVKRVAAEQMLQKLNGTVSALERAKGLLPAYVRRYGNKYRIHHGTTYSLLGTSLYYHSMLLAAQLLWDARTLASLAKAVREVEFDGLRDASGYLLATLDDTGEAVGGAAFRDWGGEAILAMLLEGIATGEVVSVRLEGAGRVPDGVGYNAELQSLFYPDFSLAEIDAITGINWLAARRGLLAEQKAYFAEKWPKSPAAKLGFYGLSAGVGSDGFSQVANGTSGPGKAEVIHPHYVLLSGSIDPRPAGVYDTVSAMQAHGLMPPWGMVESFTKDLEALPLMTAQSAAFECVGGYHLWARSTGTPDHIYRAAEYCPFLWEAARLFYPSSSHW